MKTRKKTYVCPYLHIRLLDNFLRRKIHDADRIFSPYVSPGMRVLDVGCGSGFASAALARLAGENGSVLCVDMQQEMLDLALRRAESEGLSGRITTHRCGQDSLRLDGVFDFANAFWMMHEVPDIPRMLGEIYSHLAEGGSLFIAEPKIHVTHSAFEKTVAAAETAGFAVCALPNVWLSRSVLLTK